MEVGLAVPVMVGEPSQVGEARRVARQLAQRLEFDEAACGKLAIIVTEIATNLIKHGGGGEILLRRLTSESGPGMEILALDRGEGMTSVGRSLRDGYSTSGTAGTGLGAISRLSDAFDIYSVPRRGTAVLSRLWAVSRRSGDGRVMVAGTSLPRVGEQLCGDDWTAVSRQGRTLILVVDGLGHGPLAAEVAREAVRIFGMNTSLAPGAMIDALHAGLRGSRGAAAAVTEIDTDRSRVRFAGVGNISAMILWPEGRRHLLSQNGTMGHIIRKVVELTYPWNSDAVLVEYTDGLAGHWDLRDYPGLLTRDPGVIAGVLSRDFRRPHDDVTVVVARQVSR